MQVNSGVLSVCTAFLSGEPATRLRSQELQQLIAALLEFMAVCKRAIRVHFRLIGEEDQEFHTQLVNGFQSLTAELSHYIPAILSELWHYCIIITVSLLHILALVLLLLVSIFPQTQSSVQHVPWLWPMYQQHEFSKVFIYDLWMLLSSLFCISFLVPRLCFCCLVPCRWTLL